MKEAIAWDKSIFVNGSTVDSCASHKILIRHHMVVDVECCYIGSNMVL